MENAVFSLFGLPVSRFGLGCALAALAALIPASVRIMRKKGSYETAAAMSVCALAGAWLLARLLFVGLDFLQAIFETSIYIDEYEMPSAALRFWEGGYCMSGAVLGALLGAGLAAKLTHAPAGLLTDSLALFLPLGIAAERLFEPGTGLGEGRLVYSDWMLEHGVWMEGLNGQVYPVYAFEAVMTLLVFLAVLLIRRKEKTAVPGEGVRLFLLLYGLTQVLMESLRDDSFMVMHFVRQQQVAAILFAAAGMLIWTCRIRGEAVKKIACWALTAACVGAAIVAEFGVDRWGKPFLAYGMLIGSLVLIGAAAFTLRKAALREAA